MSGRPILGLNAFHGDAAAALLSDGAFVAGVEEERFRRIKHWAGFPSRAIAHCLREAGGGGFEDLSAIAVSRQPRAYLLRKVALALSHPGSLPRALVRARNLRQIGAHRCFYLSVARNIVERAYHISSYTSPVIVSSHRFRILFFICQAIHSFGTLKRGSCI